MSDYMESFCTGGRRWEFSGNSGVKLSDLHRAEQEVNSAAGRLRTGFEIILTLFRSTRCGLGLP